MSAQFLIASKAAEMVEMPVLVLGSRILLRKDQLQQRVQTGRLPYAYLITAGTSWVYSVSKVPATVVLAVFEEVEEIGE